MSENTARDQSGPSAAAPASTRSKGDRGEERAVQYLLEKGYSVISRNYQSRMGEIDCVARDPEGVLVFVEVKYAESSTCGNPLTWVTRAKQRTLTQMARLYLAEHRINSAPCRFDVIAVVGGKVDHLRNAFLAA